MRGKETIMRSTAATGIFEDLSTPHLIGAWFLLRYNYKRQMTSYMLIMWDRSESANEDQHREPLTPLLWSWGEVCSYTSFLHCIHNTPCESWPPTLIKSSRKLSLTMGCISYCTHILHIMIQNEWKMKHRCSTNVNVSLLAPSFISWIYHYNVMFGKSGTLDKEV